MPRKKSRKSPTIERTWEAFQKAGMLWFTNRILHTFGWAISMAMTDKGKFLKAYPIRTYWRGFDRKMEEKGYERVSKWMVKHAKELHKEAEY